MSRQRLREWIIRTGRIAPGELADDTPLLEKRVIGSLQLMELVLFVESLTGKPIDVERLTPGGLRDVDTICRNFLEP
jgi:acyl carrier protein